MSSRYAATELKSYNVSDSLMMDDVFTALLLVAGCWLLVACCLLLVALLCFIERSDRKFIPSIPDDWKEDSSILRSVRPSAIRNPQPTEEARSMKEVV
jgi:hypothetical protein